MTKKIVFIFNQLNGTEIATGGDFKSKTILDHFSKDKGYFAVVIAPESFKNHFTKFTFYPTGINFLERLNKSQNPFFVTVLFSIRAICVFFILLKIKPQIIYSTGDFFCNVIPASIFKCIFPKTIFTSCVFHLNQPPHKRQSNSLVRNIFSYTFQQLSLLFLKYSADKIFLLNNQVLHYLLNAKHIPDNKLVVSCAGVDSNNIQKTISKTNKKKDQLVYFGRLNSTKGVFDLPPILSHILKECPNYRLHLIGFVDESTKKHLLNEFKKYNCHKSIIFHGFIKSKTDVYKIIASSKVAIFPSYEEGWNIALFEAIACGCPVVTYKLPVYTEIFKDSLLSAPIGDTKALSSLIVSLLTEYNENKIKRYVGKTLSVIRQYNWSNVYNIEKKSIENQLQGNLGK